MKGQGEQDEQITMTTTRRMTRKMVTVGIGAAVVVSPDVLLHSSLQATPEWSVTLFLLFFVPAATAMAMRHDLRSICLQSGGSFSKSFVSCLRKISPMR